MIVTVTPNPAIDRIVVVRGFRTGAINRATVDRVDIGGKGINVAQNLAGLGCEVMATGFLGTDAVRAVVPALAASGIQSDFVNVSGDIRVNLKILDPASAEETEVNEAGPFVSDRTLHDLLEKLDRLARRCSVMVFSGSLPPGAPDDFYARCIRIAAAAGAKTVLDTAGAPLRHGISAAPDLVKPNQAEAEGLLGVSDIDPVIVARRLLEYGPRTVVLSLGDAGAVSVSASGIWRAMLPELTVRNTVGAGDAMVAALAFALSRSLPAPDALRAGTALSAAAAASAAPVPALELFHELQPKVTIQAVAPQTTSDPATTEIVS
jgi:1-phosphofructokinase